MHAAGACLATCAVGSAAARDGTSTVPTLECSVIPFGLLP